MAKRKFEVQGITQGGEWYEIETSDSRKKALAAYRLRAASRPKWMYRLIEVLEETTND